MMNLKLIRQSRIRDNSYSTGLTKNKKLEVIKFNRALTEVVLRTFDRGGWLPESRFSLYNFKFISINIIADNNKTRFSLFVHPTKG